MILNKTREAYQVTAQTYGVPCTGRDSSEAPSEFLVQSSASFLSVQHLWCFCSAGKSKDV